MKKIILTDVDGVLLNWESHLLDFAIQRNVNFNILSGIQKYLKSFSVVDFEKVFKMDPEFVTDYNNSDFSKKFKPLKDAQDIINNIKDEYDIIAVTAMGTEKKAMDNRRENLEEYFPNAIKDIRFVNLGESKKDHFIDLIDKYGDNIICYVDDASHNTNIFNEVNKNAINFYMNRYRESELPKGEFTTINNWYDISDKLGLKLKEVEEEKHVKTKKFKM